MKNQNLLPIAHCIQNGENRTKSLISLINPNEFKLIDLCVTSWETSKTPFQIKYVEWTFCGLQM